MYVRELVLTYRAKPVRMRLDEDRQLLTPSESAEVFFGQATHVFRPKRQK